MPVLCCLGREERELSQVFEATQSLLLLWGAMDVSTASRVTPRPSLVSSGRADLHGSVDFPVCRLPSGLPVGRFLCLPSSPQFTFPQVSTPRPVRKATSPRPPSSGTRVGAPPRPESMHSFLRINAKRPPPGCQAPFRVPGGEPWTRKPPCPA